MIFTERINDIEKLKKDPNYALLWCRHGNWLIEQAEKVEQYEKALTEIKNQVAGEAKLRRIAREALKRNV